MNFKRTIRVASRYPAVWLAALFCAFAASRARAQTLTNSQFNVQIGKNGEISSLQLAQDAFPTNYVLNGSNAPGQNSTDHAWVGELMFTYRLADGAWTTALTSQSGDVRTITKSADSIRVSYAGSSSQQGVRGFNVSETYALVGDSLHWSIEIDNSSAQTLEIADLGLPMPFNSLWTAQDVVYEARTVYHSFTGQNASYITVQRPSGVGPFLLMLPDETTGAGFEYMDNWRKEEHANSAWAAGGGMPVWSNGLDVFYVYSNQIKSTGRGYLPSTSLILQPQESKTLAFDFFKVDSQDAVKQRLFSQGSIDLTVVPGMIFATDMSARIDLHTSKPIASLTPQYPAETKLTPLPNADPTHHVYSLQFAHLGPNAISVSYGAGEQTTFQFYAVEPIGAAIDRHAKFMVEQTVSTTASDPLYRIFDDWMMDSKSRRDVTGSWGWGDDWGWTKGQFLAEKNAQTPVAAEVQAIDDYLATVLGSAIDRNSYAVNDWLCPAGAAVDCQKNRPFAYPHVVNTYFSMYKIARLYPKLISYHETADSYLLRAYHILNALYSGPGDPGTGYMGEQTLPDLIAALSANNHATEAQFVSGVVSKLYAAFKNSSYPYGSEYSYDNTGEEAVYMAARANNDRALLQKVDAKTRACRGQQPVWYYYADPVTLNGENWWQFQYSVSLIGYCMDDWLRAFSATPELDERLSYAAKLGNISAINSGQIDPAPENIGAVAWTYQAMKGNVYVGKPDMGMLHSGWRNMSGEADLGLFGALRILSADLANDPLFGLYCYGCDVAPSGSCFDIVPKDGVFKRLNQISQHLHVELERDRYSAATLGANNDSIALTLQNQTGDAHMTKVMVSGLANGSHPVTLDGMPAGTLMSAGQPTELMLAIDSGPTHQLQIGAACVHAPASAQAGGSTGAIVSSGGTGVVGSAGTSAPPSAAGSGGTTNPSAPHAGSGTGAPAAVGGATTATASGCHCNALAGRHDGAPATLIASLMTWSLVRRRRRRGESAAPDLRDRSR